MQKKLVTATRRRLGLLACLRRSYVSLLEKRLRDLKNEKEMALHLQSNQSSSRGIGSATAETSQAGAALITSSLVRDSWRLPPLATSSPWISLLSSNIQKAPCPR